MEQEKFDAVILAGTHRNPKRLIYGKNKAFLEINKEPMVRITVREVLNCPRIDKVVVVGPREKLEEALKPLDVDRSRLKIIQQRSRVLENFWMGFLATFPDGNALPVNHAIDSLLLSGHLPIKKKSHLEIIKSLYAAIAGFMHANNRRVLRPGTVSAIIETRFDDFRNRFVRAEWFMSKIVMDTIISGSHVLQKTDDGITFQNEVKYAYFLEWERRMKKRVFGATCDIPLIISQAVTDFIERCEVMDQDFFFAVTTREILQNFYRGKDNSPGIYRPYVRLREAEIRVANMIFVAPNRIGNKELIQEGFGIRKMTEIHNIFRMIWKLLKQKHRFLTVRTGLSLHLINYFYRIGLVKAARWIQQHTRGKVLENAFSNLFITQFKLVIVPYGGISLDADTEEDYDLLRKNLDYWHKVQLQVAEKYIDQGIGLLLP